MLVILSLIFNIALYGGIIYEYRKIKNQKNNLYYNIILSATIVILASFYVYSIMKRRMVYTWDFANYYKIQLRLQSYFEEGALTGLKSVAVSLLMDDYNCLISIFSAFFFELFKVKSVNAFIINYFVSCIIPVIITFSFVVRKFADRFGISNKKSFYAIVMAGFVFMPLVNYPALLGQPDIFGLVFVMMLVFAALSYDFKKRDTAFWVFIFVNTILLILTRRWYMYWVVSFFSVWFVTLALSSGEDKRKVIKNMLVFAVLSMVVGMAGLFLYFKRILSYDYGDRYSFYDLGGMPYEVYNQSVYLGGFMCALIIAGFVLGVICKKTRSIALGTAASIVMCMNMITGVQNSAEHQSLIYVTGYMVMIMILLCAAENKKHRVYCITAGITAAVIICNAALSASGTVKNNLPKYVKTAFSQIDTSPVVRGDWDELGSVYGYITELVKDGSGMYIVPHGKLYNPDTFRNYKEPGTLQDSIPYGACVLGTHIFPVEFLDSEYIMTCSPLDDLDTSDNTIVKNLNTAVIKLAADGRLEQIKSFDFSNGYSFYIFKRVKKADSEEIAYLKELFYYQSQKYPEDFEGVLDAYEN